MNQLDTERDGFYHVWTLGARLRVARERVAKTQGEFALMTGLGRNTISRYESNVERPQAGGSERESMVQAMVTDLAEAGIGLLKIIGRAHEELSPAGAAAVRSMVRAILLHTIGAFHGRPQRVTCWADDLERAPIGADALRVHTDGRVSWREERPPVWPEASHPEWSSHVWARSRVRLLKTPGGGGALTIPRRSIVAIRTDAVYTTEPTGWENLDDGKVGRWVLKNTHRDGPWPRTGDDVLAMKAGER